MSDRYTGITSPAGHGLVDSGRCTRADMIAAYRKHFEHQREEADAALAFPDADLRVETFRGLLVQRQRKEVQ